MTDLTGKRVRDYQVLRRLGRGAMAEVYLAEQQSLARQVALKVLNRELASDPQYVDRFIHEARSAARLVHANIVQIYEVGQDGPHHFIAQEYVAGQNVGDLIHRQGRLSAALVLDILRQVAAALCKAAEHSIVHRDIKPENLMLARSGELKVADFGLARAGNDATARTQAGVTMGTPLYMSPEQIEGRGVDSRSDIYSLGVTAYHMLAGRPPFEGDTPLAVAVQHLNKTPPPLADAARDLPSAMIALVERMMAKRPEDRYLAPADLLRDLRALAKQAAAEGWAEGPENWSLSDLASVSVAQLEATERLDKLMKESRRVSLDDLRRRPLLVASVGGLLLGAVLGLASRPASVLDGAQPQVATFASPLEQLLHAKMFPAESAWLAVIQRFPDADPYVHHLAQQGLVRHYYQFDQPERAIPYLEELAKLSEPEFRNFGIAGLAAAYAAVGRDSDAEQMRTQLTPEMVAELEESEPQLARLLFANNGERGGG